MMTLKEAVSRIQNGSCILFTGAGFSLGAISYSGKFRLAWQIANEMYSQCDVPEDDQDGNLMSAADWYLQQFGPDDTIAYLNKQFNVQDISREHDVIAKEKWRRCYTLNYDNVLETAYHKNNKKLTPVTPSSNLKDYDVSSVCVHLNGSINNLNRSTINDEFKLTSISYAVDNITKTQWWELFESDLIICDAIFFVGCSLKWDIDVVRLINRISNMKEKTFFIVGEKESERNITTLKHFGTPVKLGINGFAKLIEEEPQRSNKTIERSYKFFLKPNIRSTKPDRDLKHFVNLITEGYVDEHLLDFSIRQPDYFPYFLYRDKIDTIKSKIASGIRNFIITSDIGNGKTILLKALSLILQRQDYEVFILDRELPAAIEELEFICENIKQPTIFIVENYSNHIDILNKFNIFRTEEHILILSERRTRYEVNQFLLTSISNENFYEISLDELSDNEIELLISLIDKNYLWGDRLNLCYKDKFQFIVNKCNRRLSQFLLRIIKANDLQKRYSNVLQVIKDKKQYYLALLYILVNDVLQFDLKIEDIINDLGYDSLNNHEFYKDPNIREFINLSDGRIRFKSSIFASYLLRDVLSDEDIKDLMVELFSILHEKKDIDRIKKQLKSMTKHSNLMKVFRERRSEEKGMLYYYRQIVDFEYCQQSPLFWLQYAIARLFDKDFKNAEICFKNSYELAKRTQGYDTYQIDNHYARFLLEGKIEGYLQEECMMLFINAHKKLMVNRKGDEHRWYSFKVAENYIPFYEKFGNTFSISEMITFKKCCLEMIKKMEVYLRRDGAPEKERIQETLKHLILLSA